MDPRMAKMMQDGMEENEPVDSRTSAELKQRIGSIKNGEWVAGDHIDPRDNKTQGYAYLQANRKISTLLNGSVDKSFLSDLFIILQQNPFTDLDTNNKLANGESYIHLIQSNPRLDLNTKASAIQLLCRYGFSPNIKRNDVTPLESAIKQRDLGSITSLIQSGANLNELNSEGDNYLSTAAKFCPDVIPYLLRAGLKPVVNINGLDSGDLAISKFFENVKFNPTQSFNDLYISLSGFKKTGYLKDHHISSLKTGLSLLSQGQQHALLDMCRTLNDIKESPTKPLCKTKLYTNQSYNMSFADDIPMNDTYSILYNAKHRMGSNISHYGINSIIYKPKSTSMFQVFKLMFTQKNMLSDVLYTNDELSARVKHIDLSMTAEHKTLINFDMPLQNASHDTLITYACKSRNEDLFLFCLKNNVNLHSSDLNGDTPLHLAAKSGNITWINRLLGSFDGKEYKPIPPALSVADPFIVNAEGKTFLDTLKESLSDEEYSKACTLLFKSHPELANRSELIWDVPFWTLNSSEADYLANTESGLQIGHKPIYALTYADKYIKDELPKRFSSSNQQEDYDYYIILRRELFEITALLQDSTLDSERRMKLLHAFDSRVQNLTVSQKFGFILEALSSNDVSEQDRKFNSLKVDASSRIARNILSEFKGADLSNLSTLTPVQREILEALEKSKDNIPEIVSGLSVLSMHDNDKSTINNLSDYQDAMAQLKSYLASSLSVKYGAISPDSSHDGPSLPAK